MEGFKVMQLALKSLHVGAEPGPKRMGLGAEMAGLGSWNG